MLLRHLGSSVHGWQRIAPGPHPWWAAGVATAALGVPLAVTLAAGQPLLAAPATFGALANLYGRTEPYARRWRTQAWTGLGLTGAVLLGGVAAALPLTGWLDVLVPALAVAVVAVVAKFVTDAVRTGPPGGLIPVFAAGTLTVEPLGFRDLPLVAVVTLTCAALAVALSCAAGVLRPDGPERNAVARALRSVLAALADPRVRPRASADLHAAWGVLSLSALGCAGRHGGWLAHAERVLDAGADPRPLSSALSALEGRGSLPSAPLTRGVRAELLGRESALPRWRAVRALRAERVLVVPALRVGIACTAAVVVASVLGLGHTYWAAVGAAAALQSQSSRNTAQRALQRSAGTLLGVGVAAVLVPLATDDARLWLLTVVCMFGVEFCMPRNYALGSVSITALSLLLTRLGTNGTGISTLIADRVADTGVGVLVGVLVAVLVRNRHAGAALEDAAGALHRSSAGHDPQALRRDLLGLREARTRLCEDDWRLPAPRAALDEAEEVGYRRLGDLLRRSGEGRNLSA
ncbi:FUSC family protein [Kineococcus sp. GCM10028916]|uniref:FUSC family protein n=1 Tax=Kineococcus sp. GCM10028916 TaxID=3273394 RepID=UPI00363A0DE0